MKEGELNVRENEIIKNIMPSNKILIIYIRNV